MLDQDKRTRKKRRGSVRRPASAYGDARELLTLVGAGTGVFLGLPYLAGRSFAGGYFAAMNIPNYQVSFTLRDYAEVGWLPLVVYPTLTLLFCGLAWTVFLRALDWMKRTLAIRLPTVSLHGTSPRQERWLGIALCSLVVLLSVALVSNTLQFVRSWGHLVGRGQLLLSSPQVELASLTPLAIDFGDHVTPENLDQTAPYYSYKGFRMLTFNDGKYYLFRDIDPSSCKPRRVYVVPDANGLLVSLMPAVSLVSQCPSPLAQWPVLPTPIPVFPPGP